MATFWCLNARRYEFSPGYSLSGGGFTFSRPGGAVATICDAHAQPATPLPSVEATLAIGARVGNYAVVAIKEGDADTYVGYRLASVAANLPLPEKRIYW